MRSLFLVLAILAFANTAIVDTELPMPKEMDPGPPISPALDQL